VDMRRLPVRGLLLRVSVMPRVWSLAFGGNSPQAGLLLPAGRTPRDGGGPGSEGASRVRGLNRGRRRGAIGVQGVGGGAARLRVADAA
jgi:hypothetical protein